MRAKAARKILTLRLNLASGRLPTETAIDLLDLTASETVAEAVVAAEEVSCDQFARRRDLEIAKDIAKTLFQDE